MTRPPMRSLLLPVVGGLVLLAAGLAVGVPVLPEGQAGTPPSSERFARRYAEDIAGVRLFMSRPEDTILSKLRWAEMCGGSEKQLHDVLRIYEVQHDRLNIQHIETWVDRLDVRALWERVKSDASPG